MNKTGMAFINDKDIRHIYGVKLIGSSFENLICRPDRKGGAKNDMISHPGMQVFDDNLKPSTIEIEFILLIEWNSFDDYPQKYDALQDAIVNNVGNGNFKLHVMPLKTIIPVRRKSFCH